MAEHRSIPFAETEFAKQEGFSVTKVEDGIVVSGQCPGCGSRTSMTFLRGTPQGTKGIFQRRKKLSEAREVAVYCECGYLHAERPPESPDAGCGAYWPVDIG